jgi:hypothetical protein
VILAPSLAAIQMAKLLSQFKFSPERARITAELAFPHLSHA